MPNRYTGTYDDNWDWEELLAQLVIGAAALYHPVEEEAVTPWAPTDVSGCIVWLKADAITGLSDGDPVSTWEDSTANGNDAIATVTKEPTYKTGILNSLPVVRFHGDYLHTAAFATKITQPDHLFIVGVATNPGTTEFTDGIENTNRQVLYVVDPRTYNFYAGKNLASTLDDADWHICTVLYNGASSDLRADGVSIKSGDAGTKDLAGLTVGGSPSDTGGLQGDIAEVIQYDNKISDADRDLVEAYLNTKYAIY